MISSGSNGH